MKIKTLKIKVEKENQEFDVEEFFEGSNTIYKTEASLQKEKDGYFWHVFITYEPKGVALFSKSIPQKETVLSKDFEDEITNYLNKNSTISSRSKNVIKHNLAVLLGIDKIEDFMRLRYLGKNSIEKNKVFFNDMVDIIQKYNKIRLNHEN
jgi:hypothetical protein